MIFSIQRSPAKVCWWVMANGSLLFTTNTKREANELVTNLQRTYH